MKRLYPRCTACENHPLFAHLFTAVLCHKMYERPNTATITGIWKKFYAKKKSLSREDRWWGGRELITPAAYLSGRTMPGLTGGIMGRAGGCIMCGPGIMGMGPPIGGRMPGPAGKRRGSDQRSMANRADLETGVCSLQYKIEAKSGQTAFSCHTYWKSNKTLVPVMFINIMPATRLFNYKVLQLK